MNFEELKKARKQVHDVLEQAKELIPSLSHYEDELFQPVKFSVLASFSTGKSTFLNAVLFETDILHTGIGETTRGAFTISYGENICYEVNGSASKCADLQRIKELIRKDNEKAAKEKKSFEAKIRINLPKLKDLIVFDTPGFGSLKENELEDIIGKACKWADGIIFLLDISRGLTQDDTRAVKDYITEIGKNLPQLPIWIVFNKLDSEEERTEEEICDLMSKTLVNLKLLDENNCCNFNSFERLAAKRSFAVSAKSALKSRKSDSKLSTEQREELFQESRMPFFETHFFQELPKTKIGVFKNRLKECINLFETEIRKKDDLIRSAEEVLNKNIPHKYSEIDNLKQYIETIETTQAEFLNQKEQYGHEIKKLEKSWQEYPFNNLVHNISCKLIECVISSLKNYGLILGDSREELIKKGIDNAKPDIENFIKEYVKIILKSPIETVTRTEATIQLFNNNSNGVMLKKLFVALEGKLTYLNKALYEIEKALEREGFEAFKIADSKAFDAIMGSVLAQVSLIILSAIGGVIAGVITSLVIDIILVRVSAFLIPVVGWVIGIVLAAWSIFGGKSTAEKIVEKVEPELRNSLPGEIKTILLQELYDKFIKDIINDLEIIANQVKDFLYDLDIEKPLANNQLDIAEMELSRIKDDVRQNIDEYNSKKNKLVDYKSRLESINIG